MTERPAAKAQVIRLALFVGLKTHANPKRQASDLFNKLPGLPDDAFDGTYILRTHAALRLHVGRKFASIWSPQFHPIDGFTIVDYLR